MVLAITKDQQLIDPHKKKGPLTWAFTQPAGLLHYRRDDRI
jgi:hypothetical protein